MKESKVIYTTHGPLTEKDFQMALPHEHIFVETGTPPAYKYKSANVDLVSPIMVPLLESAKEVGVTLMVEATPPVVGRRADIVEQVALKGKLPVAMATGFYREPWVGKETLAPGLEAITQYLLDELEQGIPYTKTRAAFIKMGATEEGITKVEEQLLQAACDASLKTGALICSHITGDRPVLESLQICRAKGLSLDRFCWFHAGRAKEYHTLIELAREGVYLCLDYVGDETGQLILRLRSDGLWSQVLVSMDSGWYNPRGGAVHGYTSLFTKLFNFLRKEGVTGEEIYTLAHRNVFKAYAR